MIFSIIIFTISLSALPLCGFAGFLQVWLRWYIVAWNFNGLEGETGGFDGGELNSRLVWQVLPLEGLECLKSKSKFSKNQKFQQIPISRSSQSKKIHTSSQLHSETTQFSFNSHQNPVKNARSQFQCDLNGQIPSNVPADAKQMNSLQIYTCSLTIV